MFSRQAMEMLVAACLPVLLVALAVGLAVSLLQAVTQINEATLSFLPKLLAVLATLALAGPWMMALLVEWIRSVLTGIPSALG